MPRAAVMAAVGLLLLWLPACRQAPPVPETSTQSAAPTPQKVGQPTDAFNPRPIGDPIRPQERPQIAHVQIADLDRDSLTDVVAADASRNEIVWVRQQAKGVFVERVVASVPAPAHVQP